MIVFEDIGSGNTCVEKPTFMPGVIFSVMRGNAIYQILNTSYKPNKQLLPSRYFIFYFIFLNLASGPAKVYSFSHDHNGLKANSRSEL